MDEKKQPVADWASDYDIFDPDQARDPAPIWKDLRGRCPTARTERWGGSWLPTRYEDVQAMVRMVPELSSKEPIVVCAPGSDGYRSSSAPIPAPSPGRVARSGDRGRCP